MAVLAFALLTTAACGKKDESPQADPTFGTVLSGTPSADPSAAASGAPGASNAPKPSSTGGGQQAPTYPSSAKDYGIATLTAWAGGNKSRLDQLAAQPAVMQFASHQVGSNQWTTVNCSVPTSGYTMCVYRNGHGDEVEVTMQDSQLGHPTATTDARVDKTRYPAAAADYVGTFLNAWGVGNTQRMTRMSSSSVVGFFTGKKPPSSGSETHATQNGSTWTVNTTGRPLGELSFKFTVNGSKLGGANAITAATGA